MDEFVSKGIVMDKHRGSELRKGRVSIDNQVYLITTVTNKRQPVFVDLFLGRVLVQILNEPSLGINTICFVIMPDHLHWLLQLQGKQNLSKIVQKIKSKSGFYIKQKLKLSEKLWQSGFHDHAIRKEEDIKKIARYIVANPLRAGLVARIEDYALWDACWIE